MQTNLNMHLNALSVFVITAFSASAIAAPLQKSLNNESAAILQPQVIDAQLNKTIGTPIAVTDSKPTGEGKFIQKSGTGSVKTVSALPPAPLAVTNSQQSAALEAARKNTGQPLDALQREINLPGLKLDEPLLKPFVLHTRNGVNEVVRLSSRLMNRIATPFVNPVLIDAGDITSKIVGSDIYVTPQGEKPIGLYIIEAGNASQNIAITILPDPAIPGQSVIVKVEDLRTVENLRLAESDKKTQTTKPNDYVSQIRTLITQAVRGEAQGFSPVPLEGGVARMGELEITPDVVFASSQLDIYRYRIKNLGESILDLSEPAFYRTGVKGISFFPSTSLESQETGFVFVLAEKPVSGAN